MQNVTVYHDADTQSRLLRGKFAPIGVDLYNRTHVKPVIGLCGRDFIFCFFAKTGYLLLFFRQICYSESRYENPSIGLFSGF